MNIITGFLSHRARLTALWLLTAIAPSLADAQVLYLNRQHIDLLIQYDSGATGSNRLNIVAKHDLAGVDPIATNHQVYVVRTNSIAPIIVPANTNFAFLGAEGAPVWTLPKSQDFNRPFLGVSVEDFPEAVFDNPLTLQLVAVEGPGNFFLWDLPVPGQPPVVKMIRTNGVVNPVFDRLTTEIGNHYHYNWGFSTNGLYRVTFRASGTLAGGGETIEGRDVSFAFQILPLRPWEQWVSTNWLPATGTDIAGPGADPDTDDVPNVMEYALGLDPNSVSTNGLPTFSFVTVGDDQFGALTFTQVKAATDVDYLPVVRSGLNTGDWEPLTNVVSLVDNGDTETITVRDSVARSAATARLYRLGVQLNYP
ncbi:MAG TPA: choice-of-anchor M domain-containing protein [Verrucomicrobiota bacterium]|nr:choice-of-anchor M domain-containing protein [Verrucomicrobiota bacterium]